MESWRTEFLALGQRLASDTKKKGCKKKTVRKQWLEDLVVNQTMQLVRDDAAMESIIAKVMELQDRENTNLPLYEKQLRDAESGIQNMLNAIQAGILTSSTKERLEQLEETKRELEARIAEEKLAKPTPNCSQCSRSSSISSSVSDANLLKATTTV